MRQQGQSDKPSSIYAALVVAAVFLGLRSRREASDPPVASFAGADASRSPMIGGTILKNLAALDWLIFAYLGLMTMAVYRGEGPLREKALHGLELDIAGFTIGVILYRGALVRYWIGALVYRLSVFGALMGTFLQLQYILPTGSPRVVDAQILAFDLNVFHVEPALAWDRFVTPQTTEWFAFFYYSYFFLLAAHVLPVMFIERRMRILAEFSFGVMFLYCVAHLIYMVVPAYGPWVLLNGKFAHELSGGFWWPLVRETVSMGGARKDVFPSLHTAGPTFLALFSIRHRKLLPFKYTWPVITFFATQIILATMFLRWHYLVDIVAGLTLASCTMLIAAKVGAWEPGRRAKVGAAPVWGALPLPWSSSNRGGRTSNSP